MKVELLICDFCGIEGLAGRIARGWVKVVHDSTTLDACPECSKTTWLALCAMRAGGDS